MPADTPMPRVLLDISPIGVRPESRTGLARVSLALAKALASKPDVTLRTCAWGSLVATADFEEVRREFPELNGVAVKRGVIERTYMAGHRRARGLPPRLLWRSIGQAINRLRNPLRGIDLGTLDVVHSTYARFPHCLRGSSLPTVMTLHDLMPLRLPATYFESGQIGITRRIADSARSADWVACVSESTRRDFLDYSGFPENRAVVIHNGVDHDTFYPETDASLVEAVRQRLGIGSGPFLLTLSSLAPHKNLRMLIDAWASCNGSRAGALVVVGGRTTDPAALMRAVGVNANVPGLKLTGFLSDVEFRALASSCQAFLFPSLYEGFGLPALEAMACGAPVICSIRTSLPEVVGAAGVLLDPTDCSAWADAMKRAIGTAPRAAPSEASLARAASFSWSSTAVEYVRLYRRALS
jgi:glycosyltransferase involved in cell wall biosynthesis